MSSEFAVSKEPGLGGARLAASRVVAARLSQCGGAINSRALLSIVVPGAVLLLWSVAASRRFLVLPGIVPSVFAGLRLSLLQCWIATMAPIFHAVPRGIGSLMISAQKLFRSDTVLAAMVLIGIVAALLNWLGDRIEARSTKWRTA